MEMEKKNAPVELEENALEGVSGGGQNFAVVPEDTEYGGELGIGAITEG